MFKIGYDVEFFIEDESGKIVSAIDRIPGTKENKYILGTGAGLHHDNVSLEIAFEPFNNYEDMESHITNTLNEVEEMIAPYKLVNKASHVFPVEELQDPKALEFGCDPDFCAWTRGLNARPMADDPKLRSNGGHIHIGHVALAEDFHNHCEFIKNLDQILGLWSLEHDKDTQRRKLYGKAGAFRPKPYGLEYRVLSNFWVLDKTLRKFVWDKTVSIITKYETGNMEQIPSSTQEKINDGAITDAN